VPLHWLRKWRRGYNQAEVIARELARALGASLRADVLRRARRTRSQTSLSAEERLRNVASVFSVRKPVEARHVLLVDDTFTTGATLASCHRVLRDALGPSVRISIATLAVVEG
jgi:ComF family protein